MREPVSERVSGVPTGGREEPDTQQVRDRGSLRGARGLPCKSCSKRHQDWQEDDFQSKVDHHDLQERLLMLFYFFLLRAGTWYYVA